MGGKADGLGLCACIVVVDTVRHSDVRTEVLVGRDRSFCQISLPRLKRQPSAIAYPKLAGLTTDRSALVISSIRKPSEELCVRNQHRRQRIRQYRLQSRAYVRIIAVA